MDIPAILRCCALAALPFALSAQQAAPSAPTAQPAATPVPTTQAPSGPAPTSSATSSALTPEEARKLQTTLSKAVASPTAKTAEENLQKAREELAKASQAYQASVEKAAVELDPTLAPVLEKTHKIQQDAQARRPQVKPGNPAANATAPRPLVRSTQPAGNQPTAYAPVRRAPMQQQATIPRPSDLLDNWVAVGVIFALGIAAVVFVRRKA